MAFGVEDRYPAPQHFTGASEEEIREHFGAYINRYDLRPARTRA